MLGHLEQAGLACGVEGVEVAGRGDQAPVIHYRNLCDICVTLFTFLLYYIMIHLLIIVGFYYLTFFTFFVVYLRYFINIKKKIYL